MIFLELFITFFIIGAFTFGGGYAMLSLIQNQVVTVHQWLTPEEFTDIVAISQMSPGPIGINSATYIGYSVPHAMGFSPAVSVLGSITATFAVVLPSYLLVLWICDWWSWALFAGAFAALFFLKANPIWVIIAAGGAGYLIYGL